MKGYKVFIESSSIRDKEAGHRSNFIRRRWEITLCQSSILLSLNKVLMSSYKFVEILLRKQLISLSLRTVVCDGGTQ